MSKLTIKNDLQTELSIEHTSGSGTKLLGSQDFKYIRDTIKDLSDITPNDGDVVLVKGYHEINDSGGGLFVYSSTESKSNHNGGTIIDSSKTFPDDWNNQTELTDWFTGSNTTNGCWKRIFEGSVNVKWFGAKGDYDYSTDTGNDDSYILTKIFNSFIDVYIPSGNYLCNNNIGHIAKNVHIKGYSRSTTRFIVKYGKGIEPDDSSTAPDNAFITLHNRCILTDVGFVYPDNFSPTTINSFPVTIAIVDYYGKIENIDLYNSYYGMYVAGSGWSIKNIIGSPLKVGMYFYEVKDITNVYKIHFNRNIDFNLETDIALGTVCDNYISEYGIAFRFGRVDFTDFDGLFCYGYNTGILAETSVIGSLNSCAFINCNMDYCTNPINLQNWQDRVSFTGCTLTSVESINAGCIISGGVTPDILSFTDCMFKQYGGTVFNISNSIGLKLVFDSCNFKDYNLLDGGYRTIYASGEVYMNIINCSVSSPNVTDDNCDFVYSTGTGRITIRNSLFDRGNNNGKLINATSSDIVAYDNIHKSGNGNIYNTRFVYGRMGSIQFASQPPTEGSYTQSDIVFNSNASDGGSIGWVCIADGTPGTWVPFGFINNSGDNINLANLPTSDPGVAGQLWNNSGTVTVSAG